MESLTERHPVPGPTVYGYLRLPMAQRSRRRALTRAMENYCEEHELLLGGVFTDDGQPFLMSPAFAGLLAVLAMNFSYGVVTPARTHLGSRGLGIERTDLIAQAGRRLMVLKRQRHQGGCPMSTASAPTVRSAEYLEAAAACAVTMTIWPLDPARPVRQARRLLRDHLAGRIGDPAVMEDVEVMASEVATNAGLYCPPPYELRVVEHDGVPVAVEVADTGPGLDLVTANLAAGAIPKSTDEIAEAALGLGGWGLSIVARLSAGRCGARPTQLKDDPNPGKSVWFAIPLPPAH